MKILILLFNLSILLFANIATVVDVVGDSTLIRDGKTLRVEIKLQLKKHDLIKTSKNSSVKLFFKDNTAVSLGQKTSFSIDEYMFSDKDNSKIKFKVLRGFFKTVTGKIGKIAPNKFKLQTKNATIGIRGTVFAAHIQEDSDIVICTDGTIIIFTSQGTIEVHKGEKAKAKKLQKPQVKKYTSSEKEKLIKNAGWHGSMTLKELIEYIKNNFKPPLQDQLLDTIDNILEKDSDERNKYKKEPITEVMEDVGFIDEITINGREFDSLPQNIQFYEEDLEDGKVIIKGLLESINDNISVEDLYVEITTNGGDTWSKAVGHEEWRWSFSPEIEKDYEFSLRIIKKVNK